jgi:hypothetical protein
MPTFSRGGADGFSGLDGCSAAGDRDRRRVFVCGAGAVDVCGGGDASDTGCLGGEVDGFFEKLRVATPAPPLGVGDGCACGVDGAGRERRRLFFVVDFKAGIDSTAEVESRRSPRVLAAPVTSVSRSCATSTSLSSCSWICADALKGPLEGMEAGAGFVFWRRELGLGFFFLGRVLVVEHGGVEREVKDEGSELRRRPVEDVEAERDARRRGVVVVSDAPPGCTDWSETQICRARARTACRSSAGFGLLGGLGCATWSVSFVFAPSSTSAAPNSEDERLRGILHDCRVLDGGFVALSLSLSLPLSLVDLCRLAWLRSQRRENEV